MKAIENIISDDYYSKRLSAYAEQSGKIKGRLLMSLKFDKTAKEFRKTISKILKEDAEFDKMMYGDKLNEKN